MARVLVVDDENLLRTMVEVACRRLGHEALCAATVAEGRRLAAAGVDVILLDMLLPDGNGLEVQQELAALPDAPADRRAARGSARPQRPLRNRKPRPGGKLSSRPRPAVDDGAPTDEDRQLTA